MNKTVLRNYLRMDKFQCRMYENIYPCVGDIIIVNVKQVSDVGAYVKLLEYNNIEGMIPLQEITKKKVRSLPKLIRVNMDIVVTVIRIDKEKGYVDLSKRLVSPEDIEKCKERFNKSKVVQHIMRDIATKLDLAIETLYIKIVWPLHKIYDHAYYAFKEALYSQNVFSDLEITENIKKELLQNIEKRLTPQNIKIITYIELTCFAYKGIEAIKEAILVIDNPEIKVKLVASPLYVMTIQTADKNTGIESLEAAIKKMEVLLKEQKGSLYVKTKPRVVTQDEKIMP